MYNYCFPLICDIKLHCSLLECINFTIWQECVKERAVKSMLCVRDISKQEAEDVVDSVFEACFNDTDPFERIPP